MALTAAGVGSGIDVEGILSSLGEINRLPVVSLETKIEELDVQLSAIGTVKSALDTFQTAVDALGTNADFGDFVANTSDEEVFTASPSNGDVAVNSEVEVIALATNHRLSSAAYESEDSQVGSGTHTFSSGEKSFEVQIGSGGNSLKDMMDAINDSDDNDFVSASIINVDSGSRLILTAIEPGTESEITASRSLGGTPLGNATSEYTEITEASDAVLSVHGFTVTRSSNTISDVIDGVTLELTGVGTATVDTRRDLESLNAAMEEFSTQYNALTSTLSRLSTGDLSGDSLPRSIETRLRAAFFDTVDLGGGDNASALDMGFTFDRNGALSLDTERFDAALDLGVNRYVEAFSKPDTGLSSLFSDLIDEYSETGGVITGRENGIDTRKSSIDSQIERMEYRLEKTNLRLRAQFTAMDLAITELNATSGFLNNLLV